MMFRQNQFLSTCFLLLTLSSVNCGAINLYSAVWHCFWYSVDNNGSCLVFAYEVDSVLQLVPHYFL